MLVDHAADRPLVIEDMFMEFNHTRNYSAKPGMNYPSATPQDTEIWRLYRNTRPEGPPKECSSTAVSAFPAITRQAPWPWRTSGSRRHMINTEHVPTNYSFRRSEAWIFGFKSENADTLLKATEGSRVEVLGGTFLLWANRGGPSSTAVTRQSPPSICNGIGGQHFNHLSEPAGRRNSRHNKDPI